MIMHYQRWVPIIKTHENKITMVFAQITAGGTHINHGFHHGGYFKNPIILASSKSSPGKSNPSCDPVRTLKVWSFRADNWTLFILITCIPENQSMVYVALFTLYEPTMQLEWSIVVQLTSLQKLYLKKRHVCASKSLFLNNLECLQIRRFHEIP